MLSGQISDAAGPLSSLFAWVADHLDAEVLAESVGMSLRTFTLTFVARTGLTPAKAVEMVRIQAAREAIEQSDTPLGVIVARCGFGDERRMRRAFLRQFNSTPAAIAVIPTTLRARRPQDLPSRVSGPTRIRSRSALTPSRMILAASAALVGQLDARHPSGIFSCLNSASTKAANARAFAVGKRPVG